MKNIVIISSTPRKGGNSEILVNSFANGAIAAGNNVEIINVRELDLKFCTGCMFCGGRNRCSQTDSMNELYPKIGLADVLVFATPVYYYSVSGQLKTFLDRLNPLYGNKNKFKEVYALLTAADDEEGTFDGTICAIQGWISCFDGVELKGVIKAGGVTDKGEILSTPYPLEAEKLGSQIS